MDFRAEVDCLNHDLLDCWISMMLGRKFHFDAGSEPPIANPKNPGNLKNPSSAGLLAEASSLTKQL